MTSLPSVQDDEANRTQRRRKRNRTNEADNNRNNQNSTNANAAYVDIQQEPQRPPPPPPPPAPAALVKLLKTDKSVLNYFQALHANLDHDVERWKHRARQQQRRADELEKELQNRISIEDRRETMNIEPGWKQSNGKKKSLMAVATAATTQNSPTAETLINDDDDEDDEGDDGLVISSESRQRGEDVRNETTRISNNKISNHVVLERTKTDNVQSSTTCQVLPELMRTALVELSRAQQTLESELGISLVTPSDIDTSNSKQTNSVIMATCTLKNSCASEMVSLQGGDKKVHVTNRLDCIDAVDEKNESFSPFTSDQRLESTGTNEESNDVCRNRRMCYRRRDDADVVADILRSVKVWAKLKVRVTSNHSPSLQFSCFMPPDWRPCFTNTKMQLSIPRHDGDVEFTPWTDHQCVEHPALYGLDILLRVLRCIDTFSPVLDELLVRIKSDGTGTVEQAVKSVIGMLRHDDAYFPSSEVAKGILLVGMRRRQKMVQQLVASLKEEIYVDWAFHDRKVRLSSPSLHFHDRYTVSSPTNTSEEVASREDGHIGNRHPKNGVASDSTNASRLSTMSERCIVARIVTSLLLHHQGPCAALRFLYDYVFSTVPSLGMEDHPKLTPVLSICVVETILGTRQATNRTLLDAFFEKAELQCFGAALATTAEIFRLRASARDFRIAEPATVEVAAYRRLQALFRDTTVAGKRIIFSFFATDECFSTETYMTRVRCLLKTTLDRCLKDTLPSGCVSMLVEFTIPLLITLEGNPSNARDIFFSYTDQFLRTFSHQTLLILFGCAKACRRMDISNIEQYRMISSSKTSTTPGFKVSEGLSSYLVQGLFRNSSCLCTNEKQSLQKHSGALVPILYSICRELGDGEGMIRLAMRYSVGGCSLSNVSYKFPTVVRVINLERRKDRMAAFIAQAMHANVVVVKALTPARHLGRAFYGGPGSPVALDALIGCYAVDGSIKNEGQAEKNLRDWTFSVGIDSLVSPQWRPNGFKAFDDGASDDPDHLVSLSPSEKACAISHISSWKGVAMTLSLADTSLSKDSVISCTWSGYARGEPMFASSEGCVETLQDAPATPVALILEDDAILVDRFSDRLDELLGELPRDFHYCAIGYAKPKTAPLVDTSPPCEHIKLPTMTWYLTGYLLSAEGARYLLSQLPVVGPVDSWIGRMILEKNWQNEYGSRLGVGTTSGSAHSQEKLIVSRKELQSCLKFKAFCAATPLCRQEVGPSWQQKDTDVVYSGNL
jgi:GR25 family glycosyltransferase involved in LPS biosynthesis